MTYSAQSSFIAAFADELRRAREYNQISLDDVVRQTRIAREYLAALEHGEWEKIPFPYLRGYLAQYAQASGMNVDKVLHGYDELGRTQAMTESAQLDSSHPLLRQPEHVGITRAKIRAAWFASLSQNRRYAYVAMVLALALLSGVLYLTRKTQRPQLNPTSFSGTVTEYRRTLRSPYSILSIAADDTSRRIGSTKSESATLLARSAGQVRVSGKRGFEREIAFSPFDTLVINYKDFMYIALSPESSATVVSTRGDSLSPYLTTADAAFFRFGEEDTKVRMSASSDSLLLP